MNQLLSAVVAALLGTACAEKAIPDDRRPHRSSASAEVHPSLDLPLAARWGWSSSSEFDAQIRYARLGAVTRRRFEDKTLEGSATVITFGNDGSYAWGWLKRAGLAESSAWERGTWEAKGNEFTLTPQHQQLDEILLNTVRPNSREDVDLAPRVYTVAALTLHAGGEAWDGIRLAGAVPPWNKSEKEFSVELQNR